MVDVSAEIDRLALELLGLSVDERAELRQRLGMAGLVLAVGRSPNCIAERDAALAEVARLREALEQVITKCHHEWCGESLVAEAFCDSCKVARAALGRTTK